MKNKQLYDKILKYGLDDGQSSFNFTNRLVRENGWSKQYAQQIIIEYKSFMRNLVRKSTVIILTLLFGLTSCNETTEDGLKLFLYIILGIVGLFVVYWVIYLILGGLSNVEKGQEK